MQVSKSKYLGLFEKFAKEGGDKLLTLRGGNLLVEVLKVEERKTAGGLILAEMNNQVNSVSHGETKLAIVLYAGSGYYNEKLDKNVPLDIQQGNVIALPSFSPKFVTTFPGVDAPFSQGEVALVPENDVIIYYKNVEDYEKARTLLR